MDMLPAILEYGLTGLAAIIVVLAYRLLQHQSQRDHPQSAMLRTIKGFMALGIVLALISAASNYFEARSQTQVDQLKDRVSAVRDSLTELKRTSAEERRALNRLIADYFSNALRQGASKIRAVPPSRQDSARCTLLRRAVFQHMSDYEASSAILANVLEHLIQDRGYPELRACMPGLLDDFGHLRTLRLRWLQDRAIPALDSVRAHTSPYEQRQLTASVDLPAEFIIDRDSLGVPTVTVAEQTALEAEVELLKQAME